LRGRLAFNLDRSKLAKGSLGEANFALGFKLFQDVGEGQLRIEVLFGGLTFATGCPRSVTSKVWPLRTARK